jgi:hypothetical protein
VRCPTTTNTHYRLKKRFSFEDGSSGGAVTLLPAVQVDNVPTWGSCWQRHDIRALEVEAKSTTLRRSRTSCLLFSHVQCWSHMTGGPSVCTQQSRGQILKRMGTMGRAAPSRPQPVTLETITSPLKGGEAASSIWGCTVTEQSRRRAHPPIRARRAPASSTAFRNIRCGALPVPLMNRDVLDPRRANIGDTGRVDSRFAFDAYRDRPTDVTRLPLAPPRAKLRSHMHGRRRP